MIPISPRLSYFPDLEWDSAARVWQSGERHFLTLKNDDHSCWGFRHQPVDWHRNDDTI